MIGGVGGGKATMFKATRRQGWCLGLGFSLIVSG
jgi:hypothetical protein